VNTLRKRLAAFDSESGLSLVEVLVAMLIFALVATGVAYSMLATVRMTNDARSRQTAANLAAAEIDQDRSTSDVVALGPHTITSTIDGITYKVAVTTAWVSAQSGTAGRCNSGTGALLDKQVNVRVTWGGMTAGAIPVQNDTLISPDARINDVDKGVIIVTVTTAAGSGYSGVSISAVPAAVPNGATAITSTISPTDAQGCGVILNVVPGNYVVTINKTGAPPSVDNNQTASPSLAVSVAAGSSAPAPFQYDQSGIFTPTYHFNYTTGTVTMPTTMDTSFVNTFGIWTSQTSGPFNLHPYTAGYSVIAGKLAANGSAAASCNSVDPGAWAANATNTLVGVRQPPAATAPGGVAVVNVPMGVFTVTGMAGKYLKASSQTTGPAGTGDPGCASTSSYVIAIPAGATSQVALPFGSWAFLSGTSSTSQTSNIGAGVVAPITLGSVTAVSGNQVLTLDPRTAP
jgi:prepilin-type N-terminal cleavage/methylation domain-containing protein